MMVHALSLYVRSDFVHSGVNAEMSRTVGAQRRYRAEQRPEQRGRFATGSLF